MDSAILAPVISDQQLSNLLIFQGVEPDSIRYWIEQCSVASFKAGDTLLQPNKKNQYMYIVLTGEVSVHLKTITNAPFAFVKEGDCIGEMSVFDGQFPSAYVKATSDIKTLAISREVLLQLIEQSHGVAKNLLYLLTNRMRSGISAVSSSQALQKEYEQYANIDVLTGLYNRRWLNNYFSRLMDRIEQETDFPNLCIVLIDIDYFKQFNDKHGHLAGDLALVSTSNALKINIRPTDMAIRYGGEEFLIILPDTTIGDALPAAERIRKGVENTLIEHNEERYPSITISLGVAQLKKNTNHNDMIAAADKALYKAKYDGRNRTYLSHD